MSWSECKRVVQLGVGLTLAAAALIGSSLTGCEKSASPAISASPGASLAPPPDAPAHPPPAPADTSGLASWAKPRSNERRAEREAMVRDQIAARGVDDPAVLTAMREVPRHWFVPPAMQRFAYADRPLPIGEEQTISQPYIVALMTEALHLAQETKVLEVGTGSGYQAAVLAEITPHVYSIEIVEPLGKRAAATFEEKGYTVIHAKIGDGYRGWPEFAPFEAIIVTCSPDHVPPPLVEQLAVGGRICIPVETARGFQELIVLTKQADGAIERSALIPVRFVPMIGEAQQGAPEEN